MQLLNLLFLLGTGQVQGGTKNQNCADITDYVYIDDPKITYFLLLINKECPYEFFADCSGQLIMDVYETDGRDLAAKFAQGVRQAWRT